jgi:hypothetical protein
VRELQLKLLEALLQGVEVSPNDTAGEWFQIPDTILNIREKYENSMHPCFVFTEARLSAYGVVKVYVRSASRFEASPPEYVLHEKHTHHGSCPLSKDAVVSLIRPATIGSASLRSLKPKCSEPNEVWRKYFYDCLKQVS